MRSFGICPAQHDGPEPRHHGHIADNADLALPEGRILVGMALENGEIEHGVDMHRAIGLDISPVNLVGLLPPVDHDDTGAGMDKFQYRPERDIRRQCRFEDRNDLVFCLLCHTHLGGLCLAACHLGFVHTCVPADHSIPAGRPKSLWTGARFL